MKTHGATYGGNPKVSVIIPAHNEAEMLPGTLKALRQQTYSNFEIIVVANGCQDGTGQIASELCDHLFVLPAPGLGRARNLGGMKASGELLVFLDADTHLEPAALEKIVEKFQPHHAAGTVRGEPDIPRAAYHIIYAVKNFLHRSRIHAGSSGVILCWKRDFVKCGGFDEGLYLRENSELIRRLRFYGAYTCIGSVKATTSMRRYEKEGAGKLVSLWFKVWLISLFSDLHERRYDHLLRADEAPRARRNFAEQRNPA